MKVRTMHVACALMLVMVIAHAAHSPPWRGPSAMGVSNEKNLPLKWSAEVNITWKVALPSWSGSTPIIWRDQIFLNVADGDSLYLWCVDRTKGTVVWKKLLGGGNHK